jgi:hypothetical protein
MKTFRPFSLAIGSLLVLAATTFAAEARLIDVRSFRELEKMADIIVVAKPVSTKDTAEQTVLPHIAPDVHVVGLSSEFEVSLVLKGDKSLMKLVVHHYRLANPKQRMGNAPDLAAFDPTESTRYLLFLQRESDGRYAPFDQVDPAWTSILALEGTAWDKMKFEDFKNWLDAKKWLNERPALGGMSPEIPASGRGEGSLHEAALNGKLEKAKALLKANPGLVSNQASYASQTPLHLAAEYGHKDVAELLLANKADVNARNRDGDTPLHIAVGCGYKDTVRLLLTDGADIDAKDNNGRTALDFAVLHNYTDVAEMLRQRGGLQ